VKSVGLGVVLLSTLLLFQNCGQSFKSEGSAVAFSICKLQIKTGAPSRFASEKVRIKTSSFSEQHKLTSKEIPVSLVLDVQCVSDSEEPLLFFDQVLTLSPIQQEFKKAALTVEIPDEIELEDIENEIDNNPCFLAIAENPAVKVSQSFPPVNDPGASQQGHLGFIGHNQSRPLQSEITEKVVIAVIDTGVDYTHPELSNRMWRDATGAHGYNFISNNNRPLDDDGHGTHVAGIVAATENNQFGVAGLTGDYVEIMAVKVLNSQGGGSSEDVAEGIRYAILNQADIINLSVETVGQNPLMEDALQDAVNAGIVVTVAAGNQADEIRMDNLYAPAYIGPGLGGVISVTSVDSLGGGLSVFSNYSNNFIEISAPGAELSNNDAGGILSTTLNGGLRRVRGTSQATPMVTAAAAILIGYLKTQGVNYTPTGIENFIRNDGSLTSQSLVNAVDGGHILNLGFLSSNLTTYFSANAQDDNNIFDGDETTGNTCIIN
jgi:hypothetical protein